jgi:FKBP-type peptidyl-prolyl cis-trans isomerase
VNLASLHRIARLSHRAQVRYHPFMMNSRTTITAVCVLFASAWAVAQSTAPSGSGSDRVTTPSGLTIITIQKSAGAQVGDDVFVLYTGRLTNGTVFDASERHGNQPIKLTLGAGQVIKGWEEGLMGANVGEKRTLLIPPELAYGAKGRGEVIPPNATLEFDVEVVGIMRGGEQR